MPLLVHVERRWRQDIGQRWTGPHIVVTGKIITTGDLNILTDFNPHLWCKFSNQEHCLFSRPYPEGDLVRGRRCLDPEQNPRGLVLLDMWYLWELTLRPIWVWECREPALPLVGFSIQRLGNEKRHIQRTEYATTRYAWWWQVLRVQRACGRGTRKSSSH